VVQLQHVTATFGPLAANHNDGLLRADGKKPMASTLTHACTARTTVYVVERRRRLQSVTGWYPRCIALMDVKLNDSFALKMGPNIRVVKCEHYSF